MAGILEVLDPTMESPKTQKELASLIDTPNGKTVGIRIGWSRFDAMMGRFEDLLRERHQVKGVIRYNGVLSDSTGRSAQRGRHTPEMLQLRDAFWGKSDYAILGLAA